jgi:hypothetical protein
MTIRYVRGGFFAVIRFMGSLCPMARMAFNAARAAASGWPATTKPRHLLNALITACDRCQWSASARIVSSVVFVVERRLGIVNPGVDAVIWSDRPTASRSWGKAGAIRHAHQERRQAGQGRLAASIPALPLGAPPVPPRAALWADRIMP